MTCGPGKPGTPCRPAQVLHIKIEDQPGLHTLCVPLLMLVAKSELAFCSYARRLTQPDFAEVSGLTSGCRERLGGRNADFATGIRCSSDPLNVRGCRESIATPDRRTEVLAEELDKSSDFG